MHPVTLQSLAGMINIVEQVLAQMKGVLAAESQITRDTPQVQQRDQAGKGGEDTVYLTDEEEERNGLNRVFQEIGLNPIDQGIEL